jgi:hypothetical protein
MKPMIEFTHPKLNETVQSISGHYNLIEEGALEYGGREVLFVVGVALVDNSCCGVGGCFFIHVPGYMIDRSTKTSPEGRQISLIEPVGEGPERDEIRAMLEKRYPHAQILF